MHHSLIAKRMLNKWRFSAAVSLLALCITNPARATMLYLEPASQIISPGQAVEVFLQISDLGDGTSPSLGAFDLVVSFDASLLTFDSVLFGDMLGPILGSITGAVETVGTLNLYGVSLDDPGTLDLLQPGQFLLASIRFTTIGVGTSSLDLSSIILGDAGGAVLEPETVRGASVTIGQAVPEGGPFAPRLFLLAFAIVGTILNRGKQTAQ